MNILPRNRVREGALDYAAKNELALQYKKFRENASGIVISEINNIYDNFIKKSKQIQKRDVDNKNKINVGRESYTLKDIVEGEFSDRLDILFSLLEVINEKKLMESGKTRDIKIIFKEQYDQVNSAYLYDEPPKSLLSKINRINVFVDTYEIKNVRFDIGPSGFKVQSNIFSEVRSSTMRRDTYTNPTVLLLQNLVMLLNEAIYDFTPSKSWGDRFSMNYMKDGAYIGRGWSTEEIGVDLSDESKNIDLDILKYKNVIDDLLPEIKSRINDQGVISTIESKLNDDDPLNKNADLSKLPNKFSDNPFKDINVTKFSLGYAILTSIDDIIRNNSTVITDTNDPVFNIRDDLAFERFIPYMDTYMGNAARNEDLNLKLVAINKDNYKNYIDNLKKRIGGISNNKLKYYLNNYINCIIFNIFLKNNIQVFDNVELGNYYLQAENENKKDMFVIPPLGPDFEDGEYLYINELVFTKDQSEFYNYPVQIIEKQRNNNYRLTIPNIGSVNSGNVEINVDFNDSDPNMRLSGQIIRYGNVASERLSRTVDNIENIAKPTEKTIEYSKKSKSPEASAAAAAAPGKEEEEVGDLYDDDY